jgi:hypothetical protein
MGARIRPRQVGDPSETIGSSFWTITRGTSDPWPKAWGFRPTLSKDGRLSSVEIKAAEIALIVEGIDLAGARCRPRWEPVTLLAAKKWAGVT